MTHFHRTVAAVAMITSTVLPVAAFASAGTPKNLDADHAEVDMLFLGGTRRYAGSSFGLSSSSAPDGAAGLVAPFSAAPYTRVTALGVGYDFRLVISHVRMTLGFDVPFPSFDPAKTTASYALGGTQTEIVPRSIDTLALRFGLGGEKAFGRFVPFADVYGTADWTRTGLALAGKPATYSAFGFGFSLHAGTRCYVGPHMFVVASGEAGLSSHVLWTARLGVGATFGG